MRDYLETLDHVMRNGAETSDHTGFRRVGRDVRRAACVAALLLVAACSPAPDAPAPAVEAAQSAPDAPLATDAEPTPPPAPVEDPGTAWERRLGNLPPDAAEVIGRVDLCTHFAGEFNGDRSERDREVTAKMDELRCDTMEADAVALREMYGDRPDVMEALDMASEGSR